MTAATYHQVWWPAHDELVYDRTTCRCGTVNGSSTRRPGNRSPTWAEALEAVEEPAHVVSFGRQVHSKGILGGSEEAGRHIGYLTKYLTKSTRRGRRGRHRPATRAPRPAARRAGRHARARHAVRSGCSTASSRSARTAGHAGPLQGPGTPADHARAPWAAGAGVAEVVRQDPRRPQGRPTGLRAPGPRRHRHREARGRTTAPGVAQGPARRPQRATTRTSAHARHSRTHPMARRVRQGATRGAVRPTFGNSTTSGLTRGKKRWTRSSTSC